MDDDDTTQAEQCQDVLDLCDASTVVNFSFQKNEEYGDINKNKLNDFSSALTVIGDKGVDIEEEISVVESVSRVLKVEKWLYFSQFIAPQEETTELKESEWWVAPAWLSRDPDVCGLKTRTVWRVRVFLLDVHPNPDNNQLDFVSGYCDVGCKKMCLFSKIHWLEREDFHIPLCPDCVKLDDNQDNTKELKLLFMVRMHVMDTKGRHENFQLWKEDAEEFFDCSVEEFVRNQEVRENRVRKLRNYILFNTLSQFFTPFMDVSVVLIKNVFFIVNTKLVTSRLPDVI